MNKTDAEKIITEYLKPIFGFALNRCRSIHDAEDLSQEIAAKVFRALLIKDDIDDIEKYIRTAAHNTLSNYYRDTAKIAVHLSIDDVAEVLPATDNLQDTDESVAAISRLRLEIAYLSKLQRQIVIAYYFENRKQKDIAKELNIPLGTVKWHLFEAKKQLKREGKYDKKLRRSLIQSDTTHKNQLQRLCRNKREQRQFPSQRIITKHRLFGKKGLQIG